MKNVTVKGPSVAIRCLVYNHEKYLRDCLNSIVMQQTNFPYFAVVHDDCSTDGSVEIIKEYREKYPDKIIPIFEETNCYQSNCWHIADNKIVEAYGDAKYIAVCEGDDYWTDPNKLQKQVDFMESHTDYSMCAHETIMKYDCGQSSGILVSTINKNNIVSTLKTDYTFDDILLGNIFHYSSLLFRHKDLIHFPKWRYRISAGDMILFRYLGSCGKAHWFPDAMSIYRGHTNSITTTENSYTSELSFICLNILVLRLLNRFWNRKYQEKIYPIVARYYVRMEFIYLSKSARDYSKALKMAKIACKYSWKSCLKYQFIELNRKIKKYIS